MEKKSGMDSTFLVCSYEVSLRRGAPWFHMFCRESLIPPTLILRVSAPYPQMPALWVLDLRYQELSSVRFNVTNGVRGSSTDFGQILPLFALWAPEQN